MVRAAITGCPSWGQAKPEFLGQLVATLDAQGLPHYAADMEKLEEQIAHLTRTIEDLSDVMARQDKEIDVLTRRVHMLMEREADRDTAGGGGVVMGDERPPHY
jgi:SlyX protein